jgi:hypothetical protein
MRGALPPLPQYVFMAWCLVKHRDNFTFIFANFISYKWFIVFDVTLIPKLFCFMMKTRPLDALVFMMCYGMIR